MNQNQQMQQDDFPYGEKVILKLEESENLKLHGKHLEALVIAQEILYDDPSCIPALEEVADNYLSLNKNKESKKTAKFILKITDDSYTANYILGFILSKENKFAESVSYLETANTLKPNNAEILRCLGWSIFMSGEKKKGLLILERALNLFSDDVMILCDLAVCYIDLGEVDKAVALLNRAKQIDPNDERVQSSISFVREVSKKREFLV